MKATRPVSVAGIEFDALIDESLSLSATVPEYPVEDGYSVSDSIIIDSEALAMTLYVTDTPVTWASLHGTNKGRVEQVCKRLEEIYFQKEPVTVITSDTTYTNMAIESIVFSKSTDVGYAREIPISFKKIRTTVVQTTTMPDLPASYGKSGTTGAAVGSANTSQGSNGKANSSSSEENTKSSILYGAAKSLGFL